MVSQQGWAAGSVLLAVVACGGSPKRPATEMRPGARPATSGVASRDTGAPAAAPPLAPPPKPGPEAFRCDAVSSPPRAAAPRAEPSDAAASAKSEAAARPQDKPSSRAKPRALPWRRLTPPSSVGGPNLRVLTAVGKTLVAAGDGIKVSTDDGATFTDASGNVDTTKWGDKADVHDVTVVGEEAVAVSELATYRSAEHGTRWLRCTDPPPLADPKRIVTNTRRVAYGGGVVYVSVDDRLFRSVDSGRTFSEAPAKLPTFMPDGLVATGSTLFAASSSSGGALYRSPDHGETWKYYRDELELRSEEDLTTISATDEKLYVSTTLGALLESADGGATWTRRWLGRGPDTQGPRAHGVVASGGGWVFRNGYELMRLEREGKPVSVLPHYLLAYAVRDEDVYALSPGYLSRSTDGGRTFEHRRTAGLANDSVEKVSASGKSIGIVASGATTYFSTDAGATFQRGPDSLFSAEVLASESGFFFSTKKGEEGMLMFQPAAGGAPKRLAPAVELGTVPPKLLGADGKTVLLYAWGSGKYLVSRDGGSTFGELVAPSNHFSSYDTGAVYGDEIIITPGGYPHRSKAGGPFEALTRQFKPNLNTGARRISRGGSVTYFLGGEIFAWDHGTDRVRKLTDSLRMQRAADEYVAASAVHGRNLLVDLRSRHRPGLYLSKNLGATFEPVDSPAPYAVSALATCDAGILLAGRGLWLLPLQ